MHSCCCDGGVASGVSAQKLMTKMFSRPAGIMHKLPTTEVRLLFKHTIYLTEILLKYILVFQIHAYIILRWSTTTIIKRKRLFLCFVCSHTWMYTSEFITCSTAFNCLKPLIVTLCDGAPAQIPVQVKSKRGTSKIYVCGICVYLELLVDVGQVRVVPVPVAFQVEPVLSFIVRVGSLLKPPADLKRQD